MWSRGTTTAAVAAVRQFFLPPIYMSTRRQGTGNTDTSKPPVSVSVDDNGIGVLKLQRPPVNAINLDVIKHISNAIDEAEKNEWKGLIITSDSPKIFTGGLDLKELYPSDPKRIRILWNTMQEMSLKLFTANFVSATAINGYAAAGGCLLSVLTDYRVMVDGKFAIGLNDSVIGIVPPVWMILLMSHVMSPRNAEIAVTGSVMYSPRDALRVNLIDELASDKEDAVVKCKQYIKSIENVPPKVRAAIRERVKAAPLRWLQENRQKDLEDFVGTTTNPETQKIVEAHLKSLKEKKNKKS